MADDTLPPTDAPACDPRVRSFTVRDGMILVAAAAVGAAGYRANDATMTECGFNREEVEFIWAMRWGPTLAAVTAGLIIARLLPPRPARRDLFRQPGFAAGCIALALTARRFLEYFVIDRLEWLDDWFLSMEWVGAIQEAAMGVLITWPVLALAGCLRAERGWIDRTLRTVAVIWVFAGIAARLAYLIRRTLSA